PRVRRQFPIAAERSGDAPLGASATCHACFIGGVYQRSRSFKFWCSREKRVLRQRAGGRWQKF
ncbi:MAG: hypothetical protein PUP92_31165, partial [Rhizonema sp. PD38]|nr:hypothetical protein [Rhizonema sp. PD38]